MLMFCLTAIPGFFDVWILLLLVCMFVGLECKTAKGLRRIIWPIHQIFCPRDIRNDLSALDSPSINYNSAIKET